MEPAINDGDVIMIALGRKRIFDGYIYAIGSGEVILVKRLFIRK